MNPDNNMLFDIRVKNHRISRGMLKHDDYAKFLAELPDEAAEAVETETRFADTWASRHHSNS